jgi:Bacterial regulatory helix-turn-helix protein, lysR family
MNLNHLAVFHAVAEAGGVTAEAERPQISQPAASKQIRDNIMCLLLHCHFYKCSCYRILLRTEL